jgi:hypothetical protein
MWEQLWERLWEHLATVKVRRVVRGVKASVSVEFEMRWLGDLDSNQGCPGQSRVL